LFGSLEENVSMPTQTANLFRFQDLEDSSKTRELADGDLIALNTVADWIKTYVVRPNKHIGRTGPVCPFVPGSLERKTLWFAPERMADRSVPDVVHLVNDYKRLLLHNQPTDGDDAIYKAIMVVFTDLSADRAKEYLDAAQVQRLIKPSYADDGVVLGEFGERNDLSAIYNPSFQPFKAPVPFLLMRPAVISDWKFFLGNEDWLGIWARRFGESAVQALAEELRRINWPQVKA
jgi:hypothetical protein